MQTSRRIKASSVDAATQNPFDSSDDESTASRNSSRSYVRSSGIAPSPNPFDDVVAHHKKGNHHAAVSTNPFDDEEHPPTKTTTARRPASTNPFDDEEQPQHAVRTSNPRRRSSPTQGRRASSEEKSKDHVSSSNRHSGSINPFDDDEDTPSKPKSGGQRLSSRAGAQSSYEKEGNAAVNLAAYNTSSNPEEFQSTQSKSEESYKYPEKTVKSERSSTRYHISVKEKMSSISDGVSHRAHKLKQGTIGQFKAGNGSADNLNEPEKPKKSGYGESGSRDLLFEGGYDDHGKKLPHYSGMQGGSRYEQTYMSSSGLEGQSVQELESYAVHKSEETTSTIYNCLRIAEDTKEVAVKTTLQLHEQGEQIRRTHETAVEVDLELSRGEKLLGSLGGLFSKTWKPKKTRNISGPVTRSISPSTDTGL
ncbi:hypothetical protein O6H91_14G007400 [Diphasiastrum complanatum]|nr:hypothetical protein O6H91_14G007400 [Diphasiastrum complanatum]